MKPPPRNKNNVSSARSSRRPNGSAPSVAEMEALLASYNQRRLGEAERQARDLTRRFPTHGFGWKALGSVLSESGRPGEAIEPLQMAARLLPHDPDAHLNLGSALIDLKRLAQAEDSLRRALAIKSDYALAHFNLGNALKERRRLAEAETSYRRVLAIEPDYTDVYNNLGNVLKDQGRLAEAASSYGRALAIRPEFAGALSNLLFTLNCRADGGHGTAIAEARRYGTIAAAKAKGRRERWLCDSKPPRLRIGLVSGDLRKHPVGYFLQSLLGAIDQGKFELFAYTTSRDADNLTEAIKPFIATWTPLLGLSDNAAATRVHADGIHILMDLSGHTAHNRLPIFAWKPAPVQVTWLGYFATTGLAEMDYVLADKVGVPPENRTQFTEKVWYLPDTRLCFTPPEDAPDISALPALTNGRITYGCFQNLAKIGDCVLVIWKRILDGLPSARLRIQNRSFADKTIRDQFIQRLLRQGIDPARVALHGPVSRKAYLAAHSEVDMLLDTFVFPGGTTTCEALWMGVPTLTLAGDTLLARQGASILTAAGLPGWIATSENDYVAKAIGLAGDPAGLSALRSTLRKQVSATPLFDAGLFATRFQEALSTMWALFLAAEARSANPNFGPMA